MSPPGAKNPEHELFRQGLPTALRVARTMAFIRGIRTRQRIEDYEQTACQALLEAIPGYEPSKGPFDVYAWKWVAGAVTKLGNQERFYRRTGLDDALDAAEKIHDISDPFTAEDEDRARLKGQCEWLSEARLMGRTRVGLTENPENMILRREAFEILEKVKGPLNDEQRQVITLRYWVGLTWLQIGVATGKSDRAAKRIDERLRKRLLRDLRIQDVEEPPPSE